METNKGMETKPVLIGKGGWERKLPPITERNWYVVEEVAYILLKRGIIHRESSRNKYGENEVQGIQQVRKYIRNGELRARLFKNSKKYGYIIDKEEVERFCREKKKELKERYERYLEKLNGE
jgi:ribosomal protein S19E (S16A)